MQSYLCELVLTSFPRFLKTCPRCKSEIFENSGCFRVNANGKRLDIWLICRCAHCKTTWNLSVCERVDRASLSAEELSGYCTNDAALNLRHVFASAFLQKNNATLDLEHLDLMPQGEIPPEETAGEIRVKSAYPLHIPAGRAIALVLGVSLSRVRRMQETGELLLDGDLRKTKTERGFTFTLAEGWRRGA